MATSITRTLVKSFNRNFSTSFTMCCERQLKKSAKNPLEREPKCLALEIEAIKMKTSLPYLGYHGTSKISLHSEREFRMGDYGSACDAARLTSRQDGSDPLVLFIGSASKPKKHFMGYAYLSYGANVEILFKHQISRMAFPDSEF
ncbi:MAG TPA: hypothetical protein VLG44_02140 [Chlamydiales bacterium]|nr:hypothetical protein [Chlamydiales bacterium]